MRRLVISLALLAAVACGDDRPGTYAGSGGGGSGGTQWYCVNAISEKRIDDLSTIQAAHILSVAHEQGVKIACQTFDGQTVRTSW